MFINLSPGTIGIRATLAESIALAKRHGFAGVDFSIGEVADLVEARDADAVLALFDEAGLKAGAWGFPVDFRSSDDALKESVAALPRLARAAQACGFTRCTTFIMPCHDEMAYAENFTYHVERMRPGAEILADHGVAFGLEWVGPKTLRESKRHPFIHTMAEALELGDAIGTGNMGLLVDAYHLYTSHASNDVIKTLSTKQVVNVHVNDAIKDVPVDEQLDGVRDLPGYSGMIDLNGFLHALREIGYDGPVTAEPFSQRLREMEADDAAAETGEAMAAMWERAGLS